MPIPSIPDQALFQSGDFVWHKSRHSFVPFAGGMPDHSRFELSEPEWEQAKAQFVQQVDTRGVLASEDDLALALRLRHMSYDDFLSLYLEGREPDAVVPYGSPLLYCGHVAILLIDAPDVAVIEAIPVKGVRKVSYADWLIEHEGDDIWLGRLRDLVGQQRDTVAQTALTQIGKPYNLFQFNLGDTGSFYCSKLVWWSVYQALGLALDNLPSPARKWWLTPKDLMGLARVEMLFSPTGYGLGHW